MIRCVADDLVPRGPNGEDLSAGAFAVRKDEKRDRAITDRRRKNWAEIDPPDPELPHACCFCALRIPDGEIIRISVADLSDYFHDLRIDEHIYHNPLGDAMPLAQARALGLPLHDDLARHLDYFLVRPCLRVMAMGDSKAVPIAQSVHRGMI